MTFTTTQFDNFSFICTDSTGKRLEVEATDEHHAYLHMTARYERELDISRDIISEVEFKRLLQAKHPITVTNKETRQQTTFR